LSFFDGYRMEGIRTRKGASVKGAASVKQGAASGSKATE